MRRNTVHAPTNRRRVLYGWLVVVKHTVEAISSILFETGFVLPFEATFQPCFGYLRLFLAVFFSRWPQLTCARTITMAYFHFSKNLSHTGTHQHPPDAHAYLHHYRSGSSVSTTLYDFFGWNPCIQIVCMMLNPLCDGPWHPSRLKSHLFVLHNTDTISSLLFTSHFLRYNKKTCRSRFVISG